MRFPILSIIILAITFSAQGQDNEKYQKYKRNYNYRRGYIITWDSIKLEGLIKDNLMNETKKFSIVTFVNKEGEKTKYSPKDIQEFHYSVYKFISDSSSFYQIVRNGSKVNLYKNMSVNHIGMPGEPGYTITSENFYVRKTNENEFKAVKKNDFKTEFAAYFGDCEKVKLKIENKEYTYKDIKEIVSEYNSCH